MRLLLSLLFIIAIGLEPVFSNGTDNLEAEDVDTYDTLSAPDPSIEAVALFRYLQDISGEKILSGQMWAPWGIDEIDYTKDLTGKFPAVKGQDYIHESSNANETQHAIDWWNAGGIPTIMWHWGAPGVGEGYENSKIQIDINRCFQEGTDEYISMWAELEKKADHLETLRDANVPVLWRPFHEFNGGWFWWGMQGSDLFEQLWITMYDYYVHDRGLNNLIWILPYANPPNGDWNPGKEYFDIAGSDTYSGGDSPQLTMYNKVRDIVGNDESPVAYHECGVPPDPDECQSTGAMWSWWMIWHSTWLTDNDDNYLKSVYAHDLVITRDELPDIVAQYGCEDSCTFINNPIQLQLDEVVMRPNPCAEILNFKLRHSNAKSEIRVTVYSMDGKVHIQESKLSKDFSIDTSGLSPNIYFVRIENEEFQITEKIIKIQ